MQGLLTQSCKLSLIFDNNDVLFFQDSEPYVWKVNIARIANAVQVTICLLVSTSVYLCLLVSTCVYLCLLVSTSVY